MNKSSGFVLFIFGATIGGLVAWYLTKQKCEARANDEIASVKETYKNKYDPKVEKDADKIPKSTKKEIKAVSNIIKNESYVTNKSYVINEDTNNLQNDPYIITPDDFADNFDYDTIDVNVFADGVICDENNEPMEDIENTIGKDAVQHFGEYDNDVVYVRNDRLKCDFEILRDERKYSEISKPHNMED